MSTYTDRSTTQTDFRPGVYTGDDAFAEGRTSLGSYRTYPEAQAVVDRLSDEGFEVENLRILGHGITSVEQVTGRMTVGRAALAGAGTGAWLGLFVALLLGLFTPVVAWFSLLIAGLLFGALWGALLGAVAQWATRGRRDFRSAQSLLAQSYEVLVTSNRAAQARRLLAGEPSLAS
ncbi:general stress protein [Ornithinimicrobium sufpigmenti]|uniref:general stress protein n=1 Tax=Ornithinimicrobium sufpigmenti TaxID=2508882 RepID=UPI001EE13CD3|nr:MULTISPECIES: general stress protein [unclassified Ornithinimicrobium]